MSLARILPDPARRLLRTLRVRGRGLLARRFCPVCEQAVDEFTPLPAWYFEQWKTHGFVPPAAHDETCNVTAYSCPRCTASDRERLFALFLRSALPHGAAAGRFSLVDFAPAQPLSAHIRRNHRIAYRTADLFMPDVDDRVDLRDMARYPDATFDAFICSHVLEHIPEDAQAMAELHRILKPGGWGIVMVPLPCGASEMREDFTKTTEAERWQFFGQGDHVRIYSRRALITRLKRAGFAIDALDIGHFSAQTFARHGLSPTSTLYVARKKRA